MRAGPDLSPAAGKVAPSDTASRSIGRG
jgi:hypothetical protein